MNTLLGKDIGDEEREQVNFRFPESVNRLLETLAMFETMGNKTDLLLKLLDEHVNEITEDESFKTKVFESYLSGRIDIDKVELLLGPTDARNFEVNKRLLNEEPLITEDDIDSDDPDALLDEPRSESPSVEDIPVET
ncbi:MAG: hypothetical protein ABEK50_11285 [bacterium]